MPLLAISMYFFLQKFPFPGRQLYITSSVLRKSRYKMFEYRSLCLGLIASCRVINGNVDIHFKREVGQHRRRRVTRVVGDGTTLITHTEDQVVLIGGPTLNWMVHRISLRHEASSSLECSERVVVLPDLTVDANGQEHSEPLPSPSPF